jgi:lipopolysaccharide export LptBFGC system permease protein LptF
MSGKGFHVHGPHDHAVEHEAQGEHGGGHAGGHGAGLAQQVAIFTAILATLGAIVSYQGGHTQNEALYYKNEAVLKKADASNQWAYYQAKGTKKNLAELAEGLASDPEKKAKYAAEVKRYKDEQEDIRKKAEALDKLSEEANKTSETALNPHNKLAMAMTFIQIAISLASICVLTRRRWMLGLAGVGAVIGLAYWVLAYTTTGLGH